MFSTRPGAGKRQAEARRYVTAEPAKMRRVRRVANPINQVRLVVEGLELGDYFLGVGWGGL